MKIFLTLIFLSTFAFTVFAQDKEPDVYQIKNIYQNADLNEKAIERFKKNIDLRSDKDEILKLFKPIKGKYKVIMFMATGYGWLHGPDKNDVYHNILILKINENNEILDGLEYVLEWSEQPSTARFVRATKKGIKLQKGLKISQLDFKTFEADQPFKPYGIIDNLYDFKEVF